MIKIIPNASLALGIIFLKERKNMTGNKIRSMHMLKKETFVFAYIPKKRKNKYVYRSNSRYADKNKKR